LFLASRPPQVAPAELEALLLTMPGVADAAVVGVKHQLHGEVPKAFVVRAAATTTAGEEVTEGAVAGFVAARAAAYKALLGGVEFVSSVPKSAAGKILRKDLRRMEEDRAKACRAEVEAATAAVAMTAAQAVKGAEPALSVVPVEASAAQAVAVAEATRRVLSRPAEGGGDDGVNGGTCLPEIDDKRKDSSKEGAIDDKKEKKKKPKKPKDAAPKKDDKETELCTGPGGCAVM